MQLQYVRCHKIYSFDLLDVNAVKSLTSPLSAGFILASGLRVGMLLLQTGFGMSYLISGMRLVACFVYPLLTPTSSC